VNKQLETEIEINAPAERVWKILTDFHAHPSWNPFIKELRGKPAVGETLRVFVKPPGGKGMIFKPIVLKADENRELRWLGKLFVSGLFDGEHYFQIESIDKDHVKFVQGENFSGLLVGLFAKSLDKGTLNGFRQMNEALKKRAEG
jgi:hypothetical protein